MVQVPPDPKRLEADSPQLDSEPAIARLPLRGDRPILEQLEEYALNYGDDRDLEWLVRNVYRYPDLTFQ